MPLSRADWNPVRLPVRSGRGGAGTREALKDMRQATPEAVIFDLGKVLLDYDWQRAAGRLARAAGLSVRECEARVTSGPLLHDFETGRISPEEFHAGVEARLKMRMPFAEFRDTWCSIFLCEIDAVAEAAEHLCRRGQVRVGGLSNTNALHVAYLRRRFPRVMGLPGLCLSNEIGVRKPDPGAYHHVAARLGVPPAKAVMVDDLEENLQAAHALGFQTLLASSPEAVVKGLRGMGLLENAGRRGRKPRVQRLNWLRGRPRQGLRP